MKCIRVISEICLAEMRIEFSICVQEEGSTNPCSETYRGTSPASEPEVKDVTEFFQ